MFTSILLSIIILIGLYFYYLQMKSLKKLETIIDIQTGKPVPVAAGVFGSIFYSLYYRIWHKMSQAQRIDLFNKKFGPVYSSYFIGPTVTFSQPEIAKEVYKKIDDFTKRKTEANRRNEAQKVMFGEFNLVSLNNPEWHHYRVVLNKAFVDNSVFFQPMVKKMDLILNLWEKEAKGAKVAHDLQKLTLDVLASCIFGTEFDTLNGQMAEPLQAYNETMKSVFNPIRFMFPWYNNLPIEANKSLKYYTDVFKNYITEMMEQTKKKVEEKKKNNEKNNEESRYLIELMYENGVSEEVIRDNISVFFLAGHETTAASLSWTISILATHPEIQEKLRKEVNEKIPNELEYDSIKDLNYMEALIKESMRFYPIVITPNPRVVEKDTTLGNYRLPKGTVVQLNLLSMNSDPKIWGDPQNVRPERWFPENLTKEQRSASIPFGIGPRVCIGMNFSLLEQKIFLVSLLKRFKSIKMAPGGEIQYKTLSFLSFPDDEKLRIQFEK